MARPLARARRLILHNSPLMLHNTAFPVIPVRTLPLNQARSRFSEVVDAALAGEPQRITRYGKDAVVMVSEAEWDKRKKSSTLGALLADFATSEGFGEDMFDREGLGRERPLGIDFLKDE